ncbi:DEAD/DEAH box helicase [Roseomonas elaeocarpi]|uniref:Transcription-repair-coupling factor n=1 Tax=Roseomonas elaeocarpi TaxID=907779 RepID=A0ABV6JRR2_9PROT
MAHRVMEPDARLAAFLLEQAGDGTLLHLARSETRAVRLAAAARWLAPAAEVIHLPAWDCLPYDRIAPSATAMGLRVAALRRLARPAEGTRLVIASLEAAGQRLPAPETLRDEVLCPGDAVEPEALGARLARLGYRDDDRVDEPGEVALHGAMFDIFPPGEGAMPFRLAHAEGRVTAIHRYDPLTQRSTDEADCAVLPPASEWVQAPDDEAARPPGAEHNLPDLVTALTTIFALLPDAAVTAEPGQGERRAARWSEITEAYRIRLSLRPDTEEGEAAAPKPTPPERFFLDEAGWREALGGREVIEAAEDEDEVPALPDFAAEKDPLATFGSLLHEAREAGLRVALCGPARRARRVLEALALPDAPQPVAGWRELLDTAPGSFALIDAADPADCAAAEGFRTATAAAIPLCALRPPRAHPAGEAQAIAAVLAAEAPMQPGDAVIHLDHGLGTLRGIEVVDLDGAATDCLALEFAGGASHLVPPDEMDRLWRYGAEAEGVTLDRMGGSQWRDRRAEVEAELAGTAETLLAAARERQGRKAPVLRPPARAYRDFAARFPHPLTPDQAGAIEAVERDLRSGRPMDRLVCGDVGYGKTEVALRAAAVAALSGKQVAVLAPTTVLARQHLESFRERFRGFGVRVEGLSRLTPAAEAKAVKAGLADGSVRVVVGTQAIAAKGVRFHDLALVIVDEEQRFGTRQKAALQALSREIHTVAMTATPIPRTLQAAVIGLRDLSVIATPPARRQPIRTVLSPADDLLLRQSLQRERRRGGQSFVVCSRIEDIAPMRERLQQLVPELSVIEAHGDLAAEAMDDAMLRFARGEVDVLLSTNIVETGLDVPRANTMLVWRADRFGLSQLHQLRGRVGRGRVRGSILLLTDPAAPPPEATLRRLRTLEAFDRVGAGFSISARDLDLRGAGDLSGDTQTGHMRRIGLALYRHMLDRALAQLRGEAVAEEWSPRLALPVPAGFPEDYVEEESLRTALHMRVAATVRDGDEAALRALREEIEDRFGPPPEAACNLLLLAELRLLCRARGVAELKLGPSAAAARFHGEIPAVEAPLERREDRVLLRRESPDAAAMLRTARALLDALAENGTPQRMAA